MTLSFVYIVFCLQHIIFHFARIDLKATYTSLLGYVHSILDIISWRHENLASSIGLTVTAPFGTCRSHTSNKVSARLTAMFGVLNFRPHS